MILLPAGLGRCAKLALLRQQTSSSTTQIHQLLLQPSSYAIRLRDYGAKLKQVSGGMYRRGNLKSISACDAEFPERKISHRHFFCVCWHAPVLMILPELQLNGPEKLSLRWPRDHNVCWDVSEINNSFQCNPIDITSFTQKSVGMIHASLTIPMLRVGEAKVLNSNDMLKVT